MEYKDSRLAQPEYMAYFVLFTAVLATIVTISWLFIRCRYGFDLTDESFYLISIANPWNYSASVTQFGFIYHPLHLLLHGDVTLLRQSNILITFTLSWILCIVFFRETLTKHIAWHSLSMISLAAVLSTCSLVYFCVLHWLATPSYNSLILQALLLCSIGLILAEKLPSRPSIVGWFLIGVGGWLAFMAKPSSAGLLSVAVGVYLLLSGKLNLRLLLISLMTAITLLLLSAWIIDGSIFIFIDRLKSGLINMKLLGGHSQPFRLDALVLAPKEKTLLALTTLGLGITAYLSASSKKYYSMIGLGLSLVLTLISFLIPLSFFFPEISTNKFGAIQILAVPFSALILAIALKRIHLISNLTRKHWVLALFFMVLPYVHAFGTNNNYWPHSQRAGIFWILAGLVILIPNISTKTGWKMLLSVIVGGQLITIILLYIGMEFPYRQPQPLRQNNTLVSIGKSHSELILSESFARYFQTIQKLAAQSGFKSNTPMIDLSGKSPGILYVLGAKSIGQAWMIGGYSGSDQLAIATLNSLTCKEIVSAWLFIDPARTSKISPEILENFGINVQEDYRIETEFAAPSKSGDQNISGNQQLLKPTRSIQAAIAACENIKSKHQ